MSVCISNCERICHNPSNASTAKALYSFGKERRFTSSYKTPVTHRAQYEAPSEFSSEKRVNNTTFGVMARPNNFLRKENSVKPSPH